MTKTLCTLLLLSLAVGLKSQTTTGSIVGTATDPSGLAVTGADVTITSKATGVSRNMKTAASGDFEFNVLDPGVYTVSIAASGFRREERTDINLTANERRRSEPSLSR